MAGPNRVWYVVGDVGAWKVSRTVAIEVAVAVAIVVAIVVARVCRPHGVTDVNTDTDTECLQHTRCGG